MKKNLVITILSAAMIIGTLTGCGSTQTSQTAQTAAPAKEEVQEVAEPTPAPEPEVEIEVVEPEIETEEEVEAEPEREVKTWDSHGITTLSYDPDNEYVAKIRTAIPECNVYQDAFIGKTDTGWTFYFEPEDGDTTEYFNCGDPGEDIGLTDDEINKLFADWDTVLNNYCQDVDNGVLPKIDLDGDGKVNLDEAYIISLFTDNDRVGLKVRGDLTCEFDDNPVIWDDIVASTEEAVENEAQ